MRNKYLLLGAASVLMLAACSEDVKGPDSPNNNPVEDALSLTSLSPSSQSGRVILPGQTRGAKANRLQLVAKIAPVKDSFAAEHNWSATGVAISGGTAYVSWHSNRQAKIHADAWGGAIDVINISALGGMSGQINPSGVLENTLVSQAAKFNNIVADGGTFYLPITSYSNGAVVGRWQPDVDVNVVDTLAVRGSSANSIYVDNGNLYIATGYQGGLYSLPTDFDKKNAKKNKATEVLKYKEDFGGKYVADGYLLRTNDAECQIIDINSTIVRNTGAALKSAEKSAEYYDGESWIVVEGNKAAHYGKHTMAKLGDYIYVGGGKGKDNQNGLRVYDANSLVWENGTNTTAVCVAEVNVAPEGQTPEKRNFIFAATGAGLRVYEPYNGRDLPLYAFEVLNYNEDGIAAGGPNDDKPVAGTDAHSSNFVAVDSATGLIFVACGQSGVYVFRLNPKAEANKVPTGFKNEQYDIVPEEFEEGSTSVRITIPAKPENIEISENEIFVWVNADDESEEYVPGEFREFQVGEVIDITPKIKDKEPVAVKYTVSFDKEDATGDAPAPVEVEAGTEYTLPEKGNLAKEEATFEGWSIQAEVFQGAHTVIYKAGEKYTVTGNVTFYPVWSINITGGGNGGTDSPNW